MLHSIPIQICVFSINVWHTWVTVTHLKIMYINGQDMISQLNHHKAGYKLKSPTWKDFDFIWSIST